MKKLIALSVISFSLVACGSGGSDKSVSAGSDSQNTVHASSSSVDSNYGVGGLTQEQYMEYMVRRATEAVEATTKLIKLRYISYTTHRETFIAANEKTDSVEVVDEFVTYFTDDIVDYQPNYVNRIMDWYEDGVTSAGWYSFAGSAYDKEPLQFDREYYLAQMLTKLDAAEADLIDHYNTHIVTRFNSVDEQMTALQAADVTTFIEETFDTIWVQINESISMLEATDK